jgi:hypothetical protein
VEVDDNDKTTTTSASPPPATTDPSPPWRIHPPRPFPVSPVGGEDAWRRWRRRLGRRGGAAQVEAGRRQRQRRRRRCDGGVWIDKLIPSLFSVDIIIFTSTKSEHSDSPWCEPITPLFLEIDSTYDYRKPKNMPVDRPSYLVGRTDARVRTMFCQGMVLNIDACGQALKVG